MKKTVIILLALILTLPAFAQMGRIPQRNEIVTIETENDLGNISTVLGLLVGGEDIREVFDSPSEDGTHHYFLSVGHLGFGDETVQVRFDPAFELFIPLGNTLDEALSTLGELQDLFRQPKGTSIEVQGCLGFGVPNDNLETVTVTYCKPLLSKILEFTVQREGYIRSSHVQKSDLTALVNGVKFYRKLHPKE